MDYESHKELCEAVYVFDYVQEMNVASDFRVMDKTSLSTFSISTSIYTAVLRILYINGLLSYNTEGYGITESHYDCIKAILKKNNDLEHYKQFLIKAKDQDYSFFNNLTDADYELYARYNFQLTYKTGQKVSKYLDIDHRSVLEIGGNSGGLGSALLGTSNDSTYTIVDTSIPCKIGNEFKKVNDVDLDFIDGDMFNLVLDQQYNYIIFMNVLHDFNDQDCLKIINNCKPYILDDTCFVIIEDLLIDEHTPKEVVMHGLRLAVECHGGKQRTRSCFNKLFSDSGYVVNEMIGLDAVHSMLFITSVKGRENENLCNW